jgi:hypothetical protein
VKSKGAGLGCGANSQGTGDADEAGRPNQRLEKGRAGSDKMSQMGCMGEVSTEGASDLERAGTPDESLERPSVWRAAMCRYTPSSHNASNCNAPHQNKCDKSTNTGRIFR